MKKLLILLALLASMTAMAQTPSTSTRSLYLNGILSSDSTNFANQNGRMWYGQGGLMFTEDLTKWSLSNYVKTRVASGPFWKTSSNTFLTGTTAIDLQGNTLGFQDGVGGALFAVGTGTMNFNTYSGNMEFDSFQDINFDFDATSEFTGPSLSFNISNNASLVATNQIVARSANINFQGYSADGIYLNDGLNLDNTLGRVLVYDSVTNQLKFRYASSLGGSGGAFWPLTGTGTLTGNTTIDTDGFDLTIGDADNSFSISNSFGGTHFESTGMLSFGGLASINGMEFNSASTWVSNSVSIDMTATQDATMLAGTDLSLRGTGSVNVRTNNIERIKFDTDGSWDLATLPGSSGNVLTSQGASSPPIWTAITPVTDYWRNHSNTKLANSVNVYPNAANGNSTDLFLGGNPTYDSVARNIHIPYTQSAEIFDVANGVGLSLSSSLTDLYSVPGQVRILGGTGSTTNKLVISASTMTITDGRATKVGMEYAGDYSVSAGLRWLADKGYILGSKSYTGIQTFGSGLASFTGAPTLADGVKWVFNPNNTNSGFNFGSNATLPSAFNVNGDATYTTTGNGALNFRINSQTVKISAKATGTMMLNDIVGITTTGVDPDAGGMKHGRVTTGSVSASGDAQVTLTWTTAFADTNYTVNCSVQEADTDALTLRFDHIESINTGSVVVRITNSDAGSAKTGTLHCIAMHD